MPHGYNAQHRHARARTLAQHKTCQRCQAAPATTSHHKQHRRAGGPDHNHNYQALCLSCHAEIHGHAWRGWAARD
jgi:HNH endonuclease